jgi:hypothetical protein
MVTVLFTSNVAEATRASLGYSRMLASVNHKHSALESPGKFNSVLQGNVPDPPARLVGELNVMAT